MIIYTRIFLLNFTKGRHSSASYYVYKTNKSIDLGFGVDGFLIKSNLLGNFLEYYNIISIYDEVNYHDDYYISYFLYLKNIKIYRIKNEESKLCYIIHGNNDSLKELSGKYARSKLHSQLYYILNKLKCENLFDFLKT